MGHIWLHVQAIQAMAACQYSYSAAMIILDYVTLCLVLLSLSTMYPIILLTYTFSTHINYKCSHLSNLRVRHQILTLGGQGQSGMCASLLRLYS